MSKFTSLTTAAALLSTLALPALATTPQHAAHRPVVKHPVHRIAATTTDTAVKPATPAMTAPATTTAAKPAATTPAPIAAKPTPVKPN